MKRCNEDVINIDENATDYNEFIICLCCNANVIRDYFLNYDAMSNDSAIELGNKNNNRINNRHAEVSEIERNFNLFLGGKLIKYSKADMLSL
jgi:hypothetical protein